MYLALVFSILISSASAAVLPKQQGGHGCPPNMKSVTFNSGYDANQFDKIGAAAHWISFGLDISGSPSQTAKDAHIPMMAFDTDVDAAVDLVNSPNAPEWMLTFNEPDWSYDGHTTTMTAQQASDSIQRLIKRPGTKTKFVAPVTAVNVTWLPDFFNIYGCKDFFSAYNLHIYQPTLQGVRDILNDHQTGFGDKPTWITEIAPGNASPACSVDWYAAADFMKGL